MAQLLVRNIGDSLVRKLKRQARAHGVSTEEEHRRILADSLARSDRKRLELVNFLQSPQGTVAPDVELDLSRSRESETRDTGF